MTTKPTLDTVLDETKTLRLKSDLSNIATALIHIEQSRAELNKLEKQLRDAAAQVEAGETPETSIQTLYQRSQGRF